MIKQMRAGNVTILDGELLRRRNENRKYLLELDNERLLLPYLLEAGLYKGAETPDAMYGGWESPVCELRGHFLGHYLSACAMNYEATKDELIRAKAAEIVGRLKECQTANGGQWVASIPEKYLYWIAKGRQIWAPQYTIHKTFMGLLDMYELADCKMALEIADNFGMWFYEWSGKYTKEEFQSILDVETGGMLEIWAILYSITKKDIYLTLIQRYYRDSLFNGLLQGVDVLTNMHANTTIPEVLGAAAVYEATGEKKYLDIVRAYWSEAVTKRGCYATGGQTCGEIWTPNHQMSMRLGDKNQEHCTVYNMMRLADFLFCETGEAAYIDYIEKNLYNGIMAQGYWEGSFSHGMKSKHPTKGLLTYFLPMRAGGRKGWSSKTQDFFCCHGSLVQANAAHNKGMYYQDDDCIYIGQYFDSDFRSSLQGIEIIIKQRIDKLNGSRHLSSDSAGKQIITPITSIYQHEPEMLAIDFSVETSAETESVIALRIPKWCNGEFRLLLDGEIVKPEIIDGFARIKGSWKKNIIRAEFSRKVYTEELEGAKDTVAFLCGPVLLAGLSKQEKALYADPKEAEKVIVPDNEREWGNWMQTYKIIGQPEGIRMLPLYKIGYEKYQIYFPILKK